MNPFEKINIRELLLQQEPFVMVDQLIHYDAVVTETRFEVRKENLFCRDGVLLEAGVLENMAQTCAVRIGYISKYILHEEVRVGFIGALRNVSFKRLPEVGERLFTRIEVINEAFGMVLVRATVCVDRECIVECEMKIALG